jgi:hypothetical protein
MLLDLLTERGALTGLYEKVQSGHFFHAVIFEGEEATQAAIAYACACVCASDKPPCGKCSDCRKALASIHPDIYFVEGSGASQSITVDNIRFVRLDAFKKANEANRKVYIIKNGENMTSEAQNALLKILEEPPEHVIFILTCSNARDLLPTVLSRCQLYVLQSIEADDQAAEAAQKFIAALLDGDEMEYLSLSSSWINNKDFFIRVVRLLRQFFRNAAIYRCGGQPTHAAIEKLGDMLTDDRLLRLYTLAEKTCEKAENRRISMNQALLVTAFFAAAKGIRYGDFIE